VLTLGHGEYWTKEMRAAFDAARDAGTNLAFLGSNTAYWQIRYEDGGRTIFGYKSMYDPNPDVASKTALFREVGKPECQLMAVQHQWLPPHQVGPIDYTVTNAAAGDPWFAGTGFAPGDKVADVVGHEWDVLNPFPESCVHPGLVDLFHFEGHPNLQNADAIRYTASSGARVFASGAQQWSWALDTWGTRTYGRTLPPDSRLQAFMRNALDDLGRPAPPSTVAVRARRRRVRVVVPPSADARVTGVRVYRDGALVCSKSPCRDRHVRRGMHTYTATYVDRWGESVPTAAPPVRVGR
jgi:hypothetical protein